MKPTLTPLPRTPEQRAMQRRLSAIAKRRKRQVSPPTAHVLNRMGAIRTALDFFGPMRARQIRAEISCTEEQTKWALERLRAAGEIVYGSALGWRLVGRKSGTA